MRVVFIPQADKKNDAARAQNTLVSDPLNKSFTNDELQMFESASLADYLKEEEKLSARELAYYRQLLK